MKEGSAASHGARSLITNMMMCLLRCLEKANLDDAAFSFDNTPGFLIESPTRGAYEFLSLTGTLILMILSHISTLIFQIQVDLFHNMV